VRIGVPESGDGVHGDNCRQQPGDRDKLALNYVHVLKEVRHFFGNHDVLAQDIETCAIPQQQRHYNTSKQGGAVGKGR